MAKPCRRHAQGPSPEQVNSGFQACRETGAAPLAGGGVHIGIDQSERRTGDCLMAMLG